MSFCETVWRANAPLLTAIHAHPFNRELAAGTLGRGVFRHYMLQDSLYLQGFARALAAAAAKAPSPDDILALAEAAKVAIVVERALHADYLGKFGVGPAEAEAATMSPACQAYVDFLLARAAIGSYGELVAALLPCFWVYFDVGSAIAAVKTPGNFYQAWIDTYADPGFGEAVAQMKARVERAAAAAGAIERGLMAQAFQRSTAYEYLFWDGAYRGLDWPGTR